MNRAAEHERELRALVNEAHRATALGRRKDAAQALRRAQSLAPEDPRVLNALGLHAIDTGDAAAARDLIGRAIAADDRTADFYLSLALACRSLGDPESEMQALDRALALDPGLFLALMQKGALLERQRRIREAATVYHAALAFVPGGRILSPALRTAIEHARWVVDTELAELGAFLRRRLEDVRTHHANERQDRFNHCLDILLGKRRVFVQQPTFMHFPELPAIAFHDPGPFPWLARVEAATGALHEEIRDVMAADADSLVPYVSHPEGAPLNQWKELNASRKWSAFYLLREGRRVEEHLARCPRTAALLDELPLADVPGSAPTAFFSVLAPKTRIPPHTGVTNTRLVVHLPLVVPAGCGFRVGAETRSWDSGTAWVFDDTIEHEAWNESEEARTVFIFDVWNPGLSGAERDLVRAATAGIREFYGGKSPYAEN